MKERGGRERVLRPLRIETEVIDTRRGEVDGHAVQPRVWDVLRLGAFQLTFLTHVPKHAAVHETVELATHVGAPKAKGFVNGVLRRVAELVTDEFTEKAGANAVPFAWREEPTPPAPLPDGKGAGAVGSALHTPIADWRVHCA